MLDFTANAQLPSTLNFACWSSNFARCEIVLQLMQLSSKGHIFLISAPNIHGLKRWILDFLRFEMVAHLSPYLQPSGVGFSDGYIDVWEHSRGGRHTNADWSPIFEDLYSSELGNPLGCRGSACVEVMTTLHGSTPSLRRLAEGCYRQRAPLGFPSYMWVHLWTFRARLVVIGELIHSTWVQLLGFESDQSDQTYMDSQVVTVDQFVAAMASIHEAITSLVPQPTPFTLQSETEVAPLPVMVVVPTSEDAHTRMDRLEQRMRQLRVSYGGMVWDDSDGLPIVSLLTKFRMPKIEYLMEGVGGLMRQSHHSFSIGERRLPRSLIGHLRGTLYGIEEGIARGLWLESFLQTRRGRNRLLDRDQGTSVPSVPPDQGPLDIIKQLGRLPEFIIRHHPMCNIGLVKLGQQSVTTNPLPAHTTHSVPPLTGGIHHMDFVQDDVIHMLSWDDGLPEMIVLDDVMTRSGRIAQAVPLVTRPFGGHRVTSVLLDNVSALNAGTIPSSLHQKVKFIHDGQVIIVQSTRDMISSSEPVLQDDVRYMARLHRDRARARLSGISFDYPVHPYTFNLADYFVRGSKVQPHVEEMCTDDSIVDELQHMLHRMQMGDEIPDMSASVMIASPSPDQANLFSLCFCRPSILSLVTYL
ncbi:hypothetical protein CK203_045852 [Vitis vinifera]|uniref:Uncharacterized protein n=1 Tax=Vitis vinifera TaxID=29760 RepID=A0A438FM37_VITVI|nr:hypothetical protein CK203_045852 [Vitis vinifera]